MVTIKADVALMKACHVDFEAILAEIKDVEGLMIVFGFRPLTRALLANSAKSGGNEMQIPVSDGPLIIIMIQTMWSNAADDTRIFPALEDLRNKLKQLASESQLLHPYIFTNYAYQRDDVIARYGQESVKTLWEVSKKYDPVGVFQRAVPGGFKLPEVWN